MAPAYAQRFQPVIFSDAGSNLYPLCDLPNDTLPKALVPVLNRPMIAYPLQWLVTAGFRSCLLVAPVAEHSALTNALRSLYLVPPGASREAEAGAAQATAVAASTSTESNVCVTMGGTSCAVPVSVSGLVEPMPAAPVIHVELVPYGPKAGEAVRSLRQPSQTVERSRWGTAQLLYWLAATRQLDQDPLVVPVDLIAPHMPLSNFLTAHLSAVSDTPTVSCLFYERGAGEGTGKERERDGPANLFTAYDRVPLRLHEGIQVGPGGAKDTLSVHEPLLVMDSDDVSDKNSSDLELRMSLLWKHPHTRISTSLLDSHVYALHLAPLLPLLEEHPELNRITEQLVPFLIKCGWQTRLSAKAGWSVDTMRGAEGGMPTWTSVADMDALCHPFQPRCEMLVTRLRPEPQRPRPAAQVLDTDRPSASIADDGFVARANTVPTFLECNRFLLKLASSQAMQAALAAPFPLPATLGCGTVPFEAVKDDESPIHSRAQLSADCLVGTGTQIDERATIKHSILGRNCVIGKGVRIMRSVLMDGVVVGDNAKLDNCIVSAAAEIGERAQLKETDVGPKYVVSPNTESKNEKLVVYGEDEPPAM
ncbi:Translation initiation factor eIF-2B subunit gamma [Malassezia equina]|uniref:Translation initiation factor eIF2B subunit gamma n=1 Tax=Malassezia equina TaxID=1381935 RepID=A0AAF0ED65_9BASI|nr:Translation initiation factor eIF-2B subunit gamma [Malassezia equina]